jgi:hypothetical protein
VAWSSYFPFIVGNVDDACKHGQFRVWKYVKNILQILMEEGCGYIPVPIQPHASIGRSKPNFDGAGMTELRRYLELSILRTSKP